MTEYFLTLLDETSGEYAVATLELPTADFVEATDVAFAEGQAMGLLLVRIVSAATGEVGELARPTPEEGAEELEAEYDQPRVPHTRGHRRPQAARAARTRRSTFLARLAYR